jgi:hypothetical protein
MRLILAGTPDPAVLFNQAAPNSGRFQPEEAPPICGTPPVILSEGAQRRSRSTPKISPRSGDALNQKSPAPTTPFKNLPECRDI